MAEQHWLDELIQKYGNNIDKNASNTVDNYEYRNGGNGGDSNGNGKIEFDCSHFENQVLRDIGYDINYQQTSDMKGSSYYDEITNKADLKKGDIVLFDGHVGFFYGYDSNGVMLIYSASGRNLGDRGPAITPGDTRDWFGAPVKYLRPKDEYFKGSPANNPYENPFNANLKISFLDWQTGGSNAEDVASVTGLSSGDIRIDSEPIADNSEGLPAGLKYYIKDKTTGEILGTYKPTGEGSFEVVMGDVKTVQSRIDNNGTISIERERYCKDEQGNFQLYDKASYTDLVDRTTVKSFDSQGNLLTETNEYKIAVGLRLAGSREDTTYDTNGDIKSWEVNNPDGSSYCYTNLGEGKYSEDTLNVNGSWSSVTYDAIGNTLSESTSIKTSDNIWTETYIDRVNHIETVTENNVATGNTCESVYSLTGNACVLVSSTEYNADGSYKVSTYDANGLLVTEEGADSDCIGYTKEYNPDGTLATMTQTSEGTSLLRTTMDDLGNFITVIIPSLISDGLSLIYDTINSIPTYVEDIGTAVWNTVTDVGNSIGNFLGLNTNPIGAFYEATTPANDNAASIADLTGRIMLNNEAISRDELEALDTNHDGKITLKKAA